MNIHFGESLWLSLIGIAIVFAVLCVLSLFIWILSTVVRAVEKPTPAPLPVEPPPETLVPAPDSAGDVKLYDVDDETAAMLMAIVADELKLPLNELQFRSIREIKPADATERTKL